MAYLISDLRPSKGFHPTSSSTVSLPVSDALSDSCTLHLYYVLPPLVFVDTHELAQRNAWYTYSHWGSKDLEKPSYALPDEPSEVVITVPLRSVQDETIHVEVPMHLRYGTPRPTQSGQDDQNGPYDQIHVDWPRAFLICPSSTLLEPTVSLPLPAHIISALPSRTGKLLPIPPHPNFTETTSTLLLPVGNTSDLAFVEPMTAFTILVCCIWLFKKSWTAARKLNARADAHRTKVE